jgi:DNA mismatch repair protein MutS
MISQYQKIKEQHKDCILFFRLGDFYEMFFEDAQTVSRELDLVLTARGKNAASGKIPMCGFPYHASANYIDRLIKKGYKVAICEQTEDPAQAKGIVKRDVIRVITSGTYLDDNSPESRLILCIAPQAKHVGIAFTDPASGTIETNQYPLTQNTLVHLISRLPVHECVYPEKAEEFIKPLFDHPLLKAKQIALSAHADWCFNADIAGKALREHFQVHNLHGFGIEDRHQAVAASGALLEYLKQMNKQPLRHMDKIALYSDTDHVFISAAAHRGLEIEALIRTIDHTATAMGKRKFRFLVYHPLKKTRTIQHIQGAVRQLRDQKGLFVQLTEHLAQIPDVEKNLSRLSCGYKHAKDLLSLKKTLSRLPALIDILKPLRSENDLFELKDIPELRELLDNAISEDFPLSHPEGKVIKPGYNSQLDELRSIQDHGKDWLTKLQEKEIGRTGINSLKVGFNKVFGYYIEVTKTHLKNVPAEYIRKQTLVNAERFITPELKEYEEKILTAQDKIIKIEQDLIAGIHRAILDHSRALHDFCRSIATIDVIGSLARVAQIPGYVKPDITDDDGIRIQDGRHPVVEYNTAETFVANDTLLDCQDNHLVVLTGPNMSGKSTYIRQTAILIIMAQIGSWVPAASASIGCVDKIFTRIGAHDDIVKGQSTFMVEMNETADILNNLTGKSLIILDEIGRGTSTYDGLSLAWAIAEHLSQTKARTLFATHFHELTALAEKHNGVKNYNVAVKEWEDEIVFLHKILPGGTDDSYGIYVAKLAGIPPPVIRHAKKILTQLECSEDIKETLHSRKKNKQISFFSPTFAQEDPEVQQIKDLIRAMDINTLTPLEALNRIQKLKEMIE